MFVSVRKKFRRGDKDLNECQKECQAFRVLPHLSEVRSIDSGLNKYGEDGGDYPCTPETLAQFLAILETPDPRDEYFLLGLNLSTDSPAFVPERWKLLGYDVAENTRWSSLHNYGSWEGQLEPLVHRLNEFGLLSLADAELARKLLPLEWGEQEHHAHVHIWALYEREYVDMSPMFVSVRAKFRRGDERWREWIEPSGRSHLSEIRSIDSGLNFYAEHYGPEKCTPETLAQALDELPTPDPNDEYYLLAIDLLAKPEYVARLPDGWKLMGYDVSDWTGASSLHNCQPWTGRLEPLVQRLNEFGLLSLADAELARKLLPLEWGDHNHHAHVTIWALYERE